MTWTVTLVPTEAIKDIWPTVMPLLAPAIALSKGRADPITVLQWLLDRRYLLWVAYPENKIICAAFVTREARYPGRAMLAVDFCGGSGMHGWMAEGTHIFRSFARDVGLDGVEMAGRVGWQKALKKHGWDHLGVLLEVSAAEKAV
jgi:hypothetical protein